MKILKTEPLLYTFESFLPYDNVTVFVTSRIGGESLEHLKSCNMGFNEVEAPEVTISNRQKICQALSINFDTLTFQQQVHSDHITIIDQSNAGAGRASKATAIANSDALITNQKGVTLFAQAADCVPIAIYDPKKEVIAAVHAGWRGTVKKIAQKTVLKMVDHFECCASDLHIAIGPSIGSCCYEVGDEVVDQFKEEFTDSNALLKKVGQRYHVDLWEANKQQLQSVGVSYEHIEIAGYCTQCHADKFYSSRHDHGQTGRFGIGITMKG